MSGRINTNSLLKNNAYKNGGVVGDNAFNSSSTAMRVDPTLSDRYDFATTEDIVLLNERKDNAEKLYEIFINSPFKEKYMKGTEVVKIDKEDILKIFYYCKQHLEKEKSLSTYEMIIAINEFFDFNYDYVFKKILSIKMRSELYADLCRMGKIKVNEEEERLF